MSISTHGTFFLQREAFHVSDTRPVRTRNLRRTLGLWTELQVSVVVAEDKAGTGRRMGRRGRARRRHCHPPQASWRAAAPSAATPLAARPRSAKFRSSGVDDDGILAVWYDVIWYYDTHSCMIWYDVIWYDMMGWWELFLLILRSHRHL